MRGHGFACSIPVGGKHIYEPSVQMHNRGNGKGGGIAAVGLVPEQLGVSREVLTEDYLLQIALLDPACRNAVEADFITPMFDVAPRADARPHRRLSRCRGPGSQPAGGHAVLRARRSPMC